MDVAAGGAERIARQARRHDPHHGDRTRRRLHPACRPCQKFLPAYPDIKVEVVDRLRSDQHRGRAVRRRHSAGRNGGKGHDRRSHRPASPDGGRRFTVLFRRQQKPRTPQDLTAHNCINLRLPTHGGLYAWGFEKNGRDLNVRVEGQLVFNGAGPMLNAALNGFGLVYLTEGQVQPHLAKGKLVRVLADWCPPFRGISPLLPEPSSTLTGARRAGRRAALSGLRRDRLASRQPAAILQNAFRKRRAREQMARESR